MSSTSYEAGTHFFDDEVDENGYYIVLTVNGTGSKFYLYIMPFLSFFLSVFTMESY